MMDNGVHEGDVVTIPDRGNALVLWKGINNQPLIVYMDDLKSHNYRPTWSLYENFTDIVDHIDICKGFNCIFASQQ